MTWIQVKKRSVRGVARENRVDSMLKRGLAADPVVMLLHHDRGRGCEE